MLFQWDQKVMMQTDNTLLPLNQIPGQDRKSEMHFPFSSHLWSIDWSRILPAVHTLTYMKTPLCEKSGILFQQMTDLTRTFQQIRCNHVWNEWGKCQVWIQNINETTTQMSKGHKTESISISSLFKLMLSSADELTGRGVKPFRDVTTADADQSRRLHQSFGEWPPPHYIHAFHV